MLRRLIDLLYLTLIVGALAACGQPEPVPQAVPTEAALENGGQICGWAGNGATMAIGDKRYNFGCGKNGDYFIGLFGEVTQGDTGWQITQAEIIPDKMDAHRNEKTVLVTHIILDDGTSCAFAGTGATTGIGDKRLNFTCGENGEYTIGLFGDITWGDRGWEITKGEVKVTPDGPVSQNVSTALIAKLGVEPE